MPYIKGERRDEAFYQPETVGELNYAITTICLAYLGDFGVSYQTYNDIMGALEGAKLEMYRRRIAPYEEQKKAENGEVYY